MKKRRSTVYVRSGKDVTLYIPSDTPPEVIDYLNQLKMDGYFSQGIMDILIKYVREQRTAANPASPAAKPFATEGFPWVEDSADAISHIDKDMPSAESDSRLELDEPMTPVQAVTAEGEQKKFSLAQIFRQSRQNSGKLVPTSDHGREPE